MPGTVHVLLVFCLVSTIVGRCMAQNKLLEGIETVGVVIEELPKGAKTAGLDVQMLRTKVELALRRTGIQVDSWASHWPSVYLNVNVLEASYGFTYSLSLELRDMLVRPRDLMALGLAEGDTVVRQIDPIELSSTIFSERRMVTVWKAGWLGVAPIGRASSAISEAVDRLLDQFLNEYLIVNPVR